MRTFAQKQNQPQKPVSSSLARPNMATRDHRGHPGLHLQRTIGNQVVQRMLQTNAEELKAELTGTASPRFDHCFSRIPIHPPAAGAIQTKLAINESGDEYEREADRISEQVMRMPKLQLQRACICGGQRLKCQTEQPGQEHERLQTKRAGSSNFGQTAVPPVVHEVLRLPGQPLDPAARAFMEPRFGYDFGQVRVHTDARAAESARAMNALAYTMGQDVVFSAGGYAPGTTAGDSLLAHELTHVVQQTGAIQRQPATKAAPPVPLVPGPKMWLTHGVPASKQNLRPLMEIRLEKWKRAAETGVENFADAELSRQIKESESFDADSFLSALIGNVIWATACFATGGAAFGISFAGIGVGVLAALPKEKASTPLMQVKTGMQYQLDQVYHHALSQVLSLSGEIVKANPGIGVDDALEIFMNRAFGPKFIELGPSDRYTELAEGAIRTKYEREATTTLRRYVNEVAPLGSAAFHQLGGEMAEWELIRIKSGGLAIAAPLAPSYAAPSYQGWRFRNWVGAQMREQALLHAMAKGQRVPTVDQEDVVNLP